MFSVHSVRRVNFGHQYRLFTKCKEVAADGDQNTTTGSPGAKEIVINWLLDSDPSIRWQVNGGDLREGEKRHDRRDGRSPWGQEYLLERRMFRSLSTGG